MDRYHRAGRTLGATLGAAVVVAFAVVVVPATTAQAATFVVNDTRDRVDSRPGNGVCRTSSGTCTLRAAVQEANAQPGADVITVRAGTYTITRAPANDNDVTSGDLDITAPVTINGAGAATTVLDGGTPPAGSDASRTALDRLIEIHPSAGAVTITNLTLREGWEGKHGGALATSSSGPVNLVAVTVRDSYAGDGGGGVYFDGTAGGSLTLDRADIAGNDTTGDGGGIFVSSGRLTLSGTSMVPARVRGNTARNGGGIYNAGGLSQTGQHGRVELTRAEVAGNGALGWGGGIDNRLEGRLIVSAVTVSGNSTVGDGGGIASTSKSTLAVSDATIAANTAEGAGGGVFTSTEGAVVVSGSNFRLNRAGGDGGGGLSVAGMGAVEVDGSEFTANAAAGEGGGLAVHSDGPVTVATTAVRSNTAGASGGGIVASGRVVTFDRLDVSDNVAALEGGGIDNQGSGEFTILDTRVTGNRAHAGGGFANRADAVLVVRGSTFAGNEAADIGGAFLHASDAATEIENSTLSGNRAGFNGGGLYLDADAGLLVANTTITGNRTPNGAGVGTADAVDNFPVAAHPLLTFHNTIVAGNADGAECHAAFGSAGGNLDGDGSCNFSGPGDVAVDDPGLAPLAENGGPTPTHALLATSPAVGGGVDPCPDLDQRGSAREPDRPCDSGSVEFAGTPLPPPPGATPPETTLVSGPVESTVLTEAAITFISYDPLATFECSLDGAAFSACVSPAEYVGLSVGDHAFAVRAVAATGLIDPTPASHRWSVVAPPDTTAPETTIQSGPTSPTARRDAELVFASDDLSASFECALDGAAFAPCTSPQQYTGLTDGPHTFSVRGVDAAGNLDQTAATWTWVVDPPLDTTPPTTTIESGPPAATEATAATFRFTASEPGSTLRCALDGTSYNACVSPLELLGLSVGAHRLLVLATDPAGNEEIEPAAYSWEVVAPGDRNPPETLLASGPESPTTATGAQFTFSANESGSMFECRLDDTPFTACSSPTGHTGLQPGDHTFEVRAVDPAGNVDESPEVYTWTIETTTPAPAVEVNLDSGPASPTEATTARFTFSATVAGATFECQLDGLAPAPCVSGVGVTGLTIGDHTFTVTARAGGSSDQATFAWTIVAPPACPQPVTVVAGADAWLDENSSTTNKGSDSILKVQSKAPTDNFRAFVSFPLPALPAGCRIGEATLSLYAASSAPDRMLQASRAGGAWSEHDITWQNQPSTTGLPALSRSGPGYVEWHVTALVGEMYVAGNHGFRIQDTEGGEGYEQQFHSREKGESPPTLTLSFVPVD